ncbi:hypothetical protein [Flavobacterium sp.]|uniref:hypothetical protein n=1 Tax=Flavobacterium sp. TaxID=239 RepID=UPI0037519A81
MDKTFILAIASPIFITIGGLLTWFIKSKKDDILLSEEKSREFKIKTYEELLEPFITVFTFALPEEEKQIGIKKLSSLEYRKSGFNLMTFGSDEVVKSYNKIMQAFFTLNTKDFTDDAEYAIIMLSLISDLLLNIRKDLYTKKTKLKRSEMLEPMITDIKKYEEIINNRKL